MSDVYKVIDEMPVKENTLLYLDRNITYIPGNYDAIIGGKRYKTLSTYAKPGRDVAIIIVGAVSCKGETIKLIRETA